MLCDYSVRLKRSDICSSLLLIQKARLLAGHSWCIIVISRLHHTRLLSRGTYWVPLVVTLDASRKRSPTGAMAEGEDSRASGTPVIEARSTHGED